jgi:hypothetical protein
MSDSETPTNPANIKITVEETLDYVVGSLHRIESQLASEEPPPWALKLFERISVLEKEVQTIKSTCSAKHGNGHVKLPLL